MTGLRLLFHKSATISGMPPAQNVNPYDKRNSTNQQMVSPEETQWTQCLRGNNQRTERHQGDWKVTGREAPYREKQAAKKTRSALNQRGFARQSEKMIDVCRALSSGKSQKIKSGGSKLFRPV
ncbi:MAG: hypothetical protein JWN70_2425 [Planctomycetaceae bacterium]|nr:hypothetical protein [Planctomycetaceae bacterium]